jgi:hypothetical protein
MVLCSISAFYFASRRVTFLCLPKENVTKRNAP